MESMTVLVLFLSAIYLALDFSNMRAMRIVKFAMLFIYITAFGDSTVMMVLLTLIMMFMIVARFARKVLKRTSVFLKLF
ncbi:hypothetical protein BK764_11440 [Bacillus thuringiensis serovar israelensis]|uniref:Uncharacterized protein n=4 Tax=Bacillus thuringiensis TaxID=1428 RepID=A0A7D3YZM4_BACTU|nr:hypothetical protein ATN07_31960 [Bacillus thuringiensis serovar israelensis]EEM74750.1 hypothetical protein bthur0010_52290 [Bacillus thuringiensis serovar pondicheriensis BGSC 4BA1]EEM99714.1 hypothetical protein bthur0014_52100 [Bacillus thuringiensis IBL 4222]KAA8487176.1 hypothetical protein FYW98_16120 [Bacillus thuringiensis]KRD80665.1 hypothetical protein ASE53_16500 [Bacillus sp. Root11]KRD85196.1 hypothetical protein ASE54_16505 [Bacillus sp. Root131]OTX59624.1 hypothetical prote